MCIRVFRGFLNREALDEFSVWTSDASSPMRLSHEFRSEGDGLCVFSELRLSRWSARRAPKSGEKMPDIFSFGSKRRLFCLFRGFRFGGFRRFEGGVYLLFLDLPADEVGCARDDPRDREDRVKPIDGMEIFEIERGF